MMDFRLPRSLSRGEGFCRPGLLLLMLVAAFLIGYCLQVWLFRALCPGAQVGRRRPVERMTLEEVQG